MIPSQNICNRRPRAQAGFSLVELMVTLLIVVLVSIMVASGVAAAQRAYANVMDTSNAQLLLSTTITELRDKLDDSSEVAPSGDDKIVLFVDGESGIPKKITSVIDTLDFSKCGIYITQPKEVEDAGLAYSPISMWSLTEVFPKLGDANVSTAPLITQKTSTEHLKVTYDKVEVSSDYSIVTFEGLKVTNKAGDTLAKLDTKLDIRRVVSS